MAKKDRDNFVTDIIMSAKRKLWWCRVALIISLTGNIILATVLVFKQKK